MATAATTCSKSRPGASRDRAPLDPAGLPLAFDNQSIFKERFYLDKDDPNLLHDEMTVIDNALTQPWTVDGEYVRNPNPRPNWPEYYCGGGNAAGPDRQAKLFPQRRRPADARPQRPAAAGFALFQAIAEVRGRAKALDDRRDWRLADYSCDDFLDNDGITDLTLRIARDLTIAGDAHDAGLFPLGADWQFEHG